VLSQSAATPPYLLIVIIFIVSLPILVGLRRRREAILLRLKRAITVEGIYLGLALILLKNGQPPLVSILAGMVAALMVNSFFKPRGRHVPAAVKRKAKAKYELKTGKKFNPRTHEYDHDVPFSKGGSHTADNIRVIEKRTNRSKSATSPWWDILGR
jgi:hypothetical protein